MTSRPSFFSGFVQRSKETKAQFSQQVQEKRAKRLWKIRARLSLFLDTLFKEELVAEIRLIFLLLGNAVLHDSQAEELLKIAAVCN